MDLKQLRYFLAVVEHGSFSAAAVALNVSQPSLSMSVKGLETELGDALLERGAKGVTLAPLGRTFFDYAKSIVREAEKALEEVQVARGLKHGRVTVGLSAVFTSFLAPEAINAFHRQHPGVEITTDVSTHGHDVLLRNLEHGVWDFGLIINVLGQEIPTSITVERIATFNSGVYAAADHPLARKRAVTPAELAAYDWIAGSWNVTAGLLHRTFDGFGLRSPRVCAVSNSFGLLRELAVGSNFLCLLPDQFVSRDIAAGRLVRLRQTLFKLTNTINLLYPARTRLTPAAAKLMEAFRVAARASSWLA